MAPEGFPAKASHGNVYYRDVPTPNATYDVLIIGGGQAAIPLAYDLAEAGLLVAVAERKHLGGSCVNFGCTPTKAVIASARLAHQARRASEFGLRIPSVKADFAKVLKRAEKIVLKHRRHLNEIGESKNPGLVRGHARILGKARSGFRVEIGDRSVLSKQLVLNTGTRSSIPPIDGLEDIDFIHSGNWLRRRSLPGRLLMIGGGYIGLEMAQFYQRMGSKVIVVEASGQIAGNEDAEVATAVQRFLEEEGVKFKLKARVNRIRRTRTGIVAEIENPAGKSQSRLTDVFVAAGRTPNSDDLGLEAIGVTTDKRGYVKADTSLGTSVPGVWVAGDLRGGPMFTHTSWDDYRIILSHITRSGERTTDRVVPYAMFTDPELGRVGLTQSQAEKSGMNVKIAAFPMRKNGRAEEDGATKGFIKVIADGNTGALVGAAALCEHGGELIHLFVDLMNANAPYSVMRDAVHIHPTLAEAAQSAVAALD